MPEYKKLISDEMISDIRKIEYLSEGHYGNLNIADTLAFYTDRYVKQILDFSPVDKDMIVADIGTGFGWLCMAFAYATDVKIIAIDQNKERLDAGKLIARILGIEDRIDWRVGGLQDLPLKDGEVDIVYCIEVLEHVYKSDDAISELCRVSSEFIVLTTPNLWFPVIAHDTQLPFCHWLPVPMRKVSARLCNRTNRENDNLFWSPYTLMKRMHGFQPISNWLHYSSYERFLDTFPYYLPYGTGSYINKIGTFKKLYYDVVSKFGLCSHWVVPSLSYVFQRNDSKEA